MIRALCSIMLLFFCVGIVRSQSLTATVSKNDILIGDQIAVTLQLDPGKARPKGLLMTGMESEEAIEMVQPGEMVLNESSGLYEQVILITSFDSGTHYVPRIGAILSQNGKEDTIYSQKIPIYVNTIPPDSLGLAPVKPIMEEEKIWTDYLMYMVPALIILVFLLALWFWQGRKRKIRSEDIAIPLPPADVEAMEALKQLKEQRPWESGEIKAYESEISLILRRYIERQFDFPAMEWTTGEITRKLGQHEVFPAIPVGLAAEILSLSDLVKYAKSDPGPEVHAAQIPKTEEFIRATKDMILEEE